MSGRRAPGLSTEQVRDLSRLAQTIAKDGASVPSTMTLTVYAVPKAPKHCDGCNRGASVGVEVVIRRGPDFHRTVREADPVARAFPIESYRPRRSRARLAFAIAAVGVVAMVAIHVARTFRG